MDPVKIAGIAAWPVPTKKVQLQSFLGFTNFYRRFIKGYSKVVKPMTQLTGNDPWKWGEAQQKAFEELKRLLAKEVVLAIPTEDGKFRVEADASEGAVGAVLSQEQDGKWRPVAFLSKSLTVTEQNYEIYDKELLAIMLALDEWRHYPNGSGSGFRNLDRSSESPVFPKAPEAEPPPSTLGNGTSGIPLLSPPQTGSVKQESRLTQSQSRSRHGEGGQ